MTLMVPSNIANYIASSSSKIGGHHQRFILGVSALATQPVIDYCNKDVDEKTRKYAVARTIVKILVGTSIGVAVRFASLKGAQYIIKNNIIKFSDAILKDKISKEKMILTLGDTLGLIACFFTNFLVDAPLSKQGINYVVKKYHIDDPKRKESK